MLFASLYANLISTRSLFSELFENRVRAKIIYYFATVNSDTFSEL